MRLGAAALLLLGCGRLGFEPRIGGTDGGDPDAPPIASGFSKVIAYADQTCALHDGTLYCWGENGSAQLGDGTTMNRAAPTPVGVPAGTVRSFAQGQDHGCAVVDDTLYCYGESFLAAPMPVVLDAPARIVDAGQDFTCVVADQLYCWGDNSAGQLGDGTTNPRLEPTAIGLAGSVVGIDAGDDHACAITANGTVSCWGHNDQGALGLGAFDPQSVPTPQAILSEITTLPRIAGWHACSLQQGQVRCWGRGTEGELGNGIDADNPDPVLLPLQGITVLATGGGPADLDATCASSGTGVVCWGAGATGRLGDGMRMDRNTPVEVIGLPAVTVRDLAIGYGHACALLDDGNLWCWGRGTAGQLGNGAFADRLAPVLVTRP